MHAFMFEAWFHRAHQFNFSFYALNVQFSMSKPPFASKSQRTFVDLSLFFISSTRVLGVSNRDTWSFSWAGIGGWTLFGALDRCVCHVVIAHWLNGVVFTPLPPRPPLALFQARSCGIAWRFQHRSWLYLYIYYIYIKNMSSTRNACKLIFRCNIENRAEQVLMENEPFQKHASITLRALWSKIRMQGFNETIGCLEHWWLTGTV
jgi:hypothetical protein